jgi:benzoylformate decarboxylase
MDITDPPIDYLAMAQSWGVPGVSITKAGDIGGAIEAGIASARANLIEIMISA